LCCTPGPTRPRADHSSWGDLRLGDALLGQRSMAPASSARVAHLSGQHGVVVLAGDVGERRCGIVARNLHAAHVATDPCSVFHLRARVEDLQLAELGSILDEVQQPADLVITPSTANIHQSKSRLMLGELPTQSG
jgi:hypothetical protein